MRQKIIKLKEEGKTNKEIAKLLGISPSTVQYHSNQNYRILQINRGKEYFKKLTPEEREKYNESRREYNKEYQRKKYALIKLRKQEEK